MKAVKALRRQRVQRRRKLPDSDMTWTTQRQVKQNLVSGQAG